MNPIQVSLLITGIGMGLVFIAIILLWAMMELVVKSTADKPTKLNEDSSETGEVGDFIQPAPREDQSARRKAAAAAVAFAIAAEKTIPISQPELPAQGNLSTWQAVMRAGNLNQISNFQKRSPKGSKR